VPALDEAVELPGTLEAVAAVFPEAEVIVADGGSRDDTARIAAASARVVRSAPGRGRQLNAGAEAASGDVLVFLHADTHVCEGAREALQTVLAEDRVVGGCFELGLRGPSARRPIARVLSTAINLRSRLLSTATGDQAIFARRRVFDGLGGFAELDLFEDVLFYRRLRRAGRVVVLRPPVLTSDRRWCSRGYLRTIGIHLWLRCLLALGVEPARLADRYR